MGAISEAVRHMLNAGMPADAIADAVADMEAAYAPASSRTKGAERTARWRERHKASQSVTVTECDAPSPDKESPHTPKETNPNPTPPIAPPSQARRAQPALVLQSVLDPMTADRFARHCAGKRRPLSEESAEAIAATLREIRAGGGKPAEAVALAIKRGWTTIEIEWLRNAGFPLGSVPKPAEAQFDWSAAIELYRKDGFWASGWGPKPGESGCRVPARFLSELAA